MRKLSLNEFIKNSIALVTVSATGIDAGILIANRTGILDIAGDWYLYAPVGVWFVASIPISITLIGRIVHQVDPRPGRISAFAEGAPSPALRLIPFSVKGQRGGLLASAAPSLFGEALPLESERIGVYRPAAWRVPVDGNDQVVRESELRAFLDVCHNRRRHQFSRNYWTRTRRPPMYRPKYEALMRLLVEADLVDGRHSHGGASGRLVTKPHHAITYLKYESHYAISR